MIQSIVFIRAFFARLVTRRWRMLLLIGVLVFIPVMFLQWIMLEEQHDGLSKWGLWFPENRLSMQLLDSGLSDTDLADQDAVVSKKVWQTVQNGSGASPIGRPAQYCNMPIPRGEEGETSLGKKWRISAVFVILRHGARASLLNNLPRYADPPNCSLDDLKKYQDRELSRFLELLKVKQPLNSGHFEGQSMYPNSAKCPRGGLTAMGVLQNFVLGRRMMEAYPRLLRSLSPEEVYMRTTKFSRSFHSANAFLTAIFMDQHFHSVKVREASSLAFCSGRLVSCTCPKLRYFYSLYTKRRTELSNTDLYIPKVRDNFARFFNLATTPDYLTLTHLVDWLMPGACLGVNTKGHLADVCWKSGSTSKVKGTVAGRCTTRILIEQLWKAEDRLGAALASFGPFVQYAKLIAYPLLRDLVAKMRHFENDLGPTSNRRPTHKTDVEEEGHHASAHDLTGDDDDGAEREEKATTKPKKPRFFIYHGHDHTLRYLLSSLGLYTGQWPPFASRLVLEVFQSVESTSDLRFRLLYNGRDLTTELTACKHWRRAQLTSTVSSASDLVACPVRVLEEILKGAFWTGFQTTNYTAECLRSSTDYFT